MGRSSSQTNDQPGTFKCARSRCKTSHFIHNIEKMSGPKRPIKITDHLKCTSDDVIYLHNLACTYFIKLYIGETGRRLGDRFRDLLRDLDRNDKDASKLVAKKSSVFLISTFLSFQISIKFHIFAYVLHGSGCFLIFLCSFYEQENWRAAGQNLGPPHMPIINHLTPKI